MVYSTYGTSVDLVRSNLRALERRLQQVLHLGLLLHLLRVCLHLLRVCLHLLHLLRLRLHLHSLRLSTLHPSLALVLHLYTSQLEVAVVSGPIQLLLAKSSPLALLATLALSMRMSSSART